MGRDREHGTGGALMEQEERRSRRGALRLAVAAVAVPALVVTMAAWRERPLAAVGAGGFLAVLAALSEVDLAEHRLPNRLVGPLVAATTAWVVGAGVAGDEPGRAGRAVVVGLVVAGLFLVLSLVGDLGMGDVKLSLPVAMVAGWLGLRAGETMVLVAGLAGMVAAAVTLARGRAGTRLPFGPFLALGALAGLLVAAPG